MRDFKLYARRDFALDAGLGDSAFDKTGELEWPSRLERDMPRPALAATPCPEPELILEKDGWAYLVYIRHDLIRYGVDGYGRRVYGRSRARRYGKKLLKHYLKTLQGPELG